MYSFLKIHSSTISKKKKENKINSLACVSAVLVSWDQKRLLRVFCVCNSCVHHQDLSHLPPLFNAPSGSSAMTLIILINLKNVLLYCYSPFLCGRPSGMLAFSPPLRSCGSLLHCKSPACG